MQTFQIKSLLVMASLALASCDFLTQSDSSSFTVVKYVLKGTALALGDVHGCVLTEDSKIFCWGDNSYGQLGTQLVGAQTSSASAVQTDDPNPRDPWINVYAAAYRTCASKKSGRLYCWGSNFRGELGLIGQPSKVGTFYFQPQEIFWTDPTEVGGSPRSFSQIATTLDVTMGRDTSCAYTPGEIHFYCWGNVGALYSSGFQSSYEIQNRIDTCVNNKPWACAKSEIVADNNPSFVSYAYYSEPLKSFHLLFGGTINGMNLSGDSFCLNATYPSFKNRILGSCYGRLNTEFKALTNQHQMIIPIYSKEYFIAVIGDQRIDPRCAASAPGASHKCTLFSITDRSEVIAPLIYSLSTSGTASSPTSQTTNDDRSTFRDELKTFSFYQNSGYSYLSCGLSDSNAIACSSNSDISFSNQRLSTSNPDHSYDNFSVAFLIDQWFDQRAVVTRSANFGLTKFSDDVIDFELGQGLMCALVDSGNVECLGFNNLGQSGNASYVPISSINRITIEEGF